VPVRMERSVRVLPPDPDGPVLQRWRRITKEAAKQSGRFGLPRICGPLVLTDAVRRMGDVPLRLYCDPSQQGLSLRRVRQSHPDPGGIAVVIGPEGGVSEADETLLRDHGFLPVSLGQGVLRVETAGVVAVALTRYEWHDRGQTRMDETGRP
jgi:16S rRNA (uracil1498-N3)-methyltransferase